MPTLNHYVMLTDAEETKLHNITHKGSGQSARAILHAQILLLVTARGTCPIKTHEK